MGFPRNLGDPVDLRSQSPAGTIRLIKSQARGRGAWHPRERNPRAQERYRHAKATERAGWTREVLVPSSYRVKAGKPNPRKPVSREGRDRVTEPL